MEGVSTSRAFVLCAAVALLAVGLATGRPEALAAADTEYLYEGEALMAELEDAQGLEAEATEEVRERREALPTSPPPPPMPYNDSAVDMLVDGFEANGSLEPQLVPNLGHEKKACGRRRNRPPTNNGTGTGTTATDETDDLAGSGRAGANSTDRLVL